MFKLALKNVISKPFRSIATALAIAVTVAMIFCMLSFRNAVYDYIYSTEIAASGDSEIVISTSSSDSDRITTVTEPLREMQGVEYVCPTLNLYATLNGEYVRVRGFEAGSLERVHKIDILNGDFSKINDNVETDGTVISRSAAKHFNLSVGDRVTLSLGRNAVQFIVSGIAEESGYFLDDSPYLFVGLISRVSRLVLNMSSMICNEIYVKVASGADVDRVLNEINGMDAYKNTLVKKINIGYVDEQTNSLTAPIVLAGCAVFVLGVAIIVMLFKASEGEKINLISKYGVIGASRKQIFGIFFTESVILALVGALIGLGLAVGVFVGILKLTLSSTVTFEISALNLIGAFLIGIASAIIGALLPILKSFKGTIRQNQIGIGKKSKVPFILFAVFAALTVISVIVEFTVPVSTKIMSVFSLIFTFLTLGVGVGVVDFGISTGLKKSKSPVMQLAGINTTRAKTSTVAMLTLGVTLSVMLFMAYSVTKSVFSDYVNDFSDMIFVTNIREADVSEDNDNNLLKQFAALDGVKQATSIVWRQGSLEVGGMQKTMNVLGTKDALNIVDFDYVTDKSEVEAKLSSNENYIFLDEALSVLYGVKTGDKLNLSFSETAKEVQVGGILKHRLFSGNYVVMSDSLIKELYGISADAVLVKVNGDVQSVAGSLQSLYAQRNFYVVSVLESYRWDMQSTSAVFDLIGTLAAVVTVFIFLVTVSTTLIGRSEGDKKRSAMLNAGMSKNTLLKLELFEHGKVAVIGFVFSVLTSVLITSSLIHALRLFGLYFEFMFNAWVVVLVSGIICLLYAILPLALNFKKSYTVKRR